MGGATSVWPGQHLPLISLAGVVVLIALKKILVNQLYEQPSRLFALGCFHENQSPNCRQVFIVERVLAYRRVLTLGEAASGWGGETRRVLSQCQPNCQAETLADYKFVQSWNALPIPWQRLLPFIGSFAPDTVEQFITQQGKHDRQASEQHTRCCRVNSIFWLKEASSKFISGLTCFKLIYRVSNFICAENINPEHFRQGFSPCRP